MTDNHIDTRVLDAMRGRDRLVNNLIKLYSSVKKLADNITNLKKFLNDIGLDTDASKEVINSMLFHFQSRDMMASRTIESADVISDLYVELISAFNTDDLDKLGKISKRIDEAIIAEG